MSFSLPVVYLVFVYKSVVSLSSDELPCLHIDLGVDRLPQTDLSLADTYVPVGYVYCTWKSKPKQPCRQMIAARNHAISPLLRQT